MIDRVVAAEKPATWERYAWAAGVIFVLALLVDFVIAASIPINQNDSAVKIATELNANSTRLLVIAGVCVVYAAMFPIYLWKLSDLLGVDQRRTIVSLVLVGGVLLVALHAVSDIAITGLVGAKVASYSVQHDPGISYTLYLMTFAISSVGDVFGSLFLFTAGLLARRTTLLPRWLAWIAIVAAIFLFLQGFGLGGVIATFGLAFDLIGFVLFLLFVLVSSVIMLGRERGVAHRDNRAE
jgi:hypothetical protein